jgi:hypothetical protein
MQKRVLIFYLSLLVLLASYFYTLTVNKFGHATALGPKQAIANCNVKIDSEGTLSNETIEMHTVDHNIKIIEA